MNRRNVIAIVLALLVTAGAAFGVQAAASALQDDAPKAGKREGGRHFGGKFGRRGGRGFGGMLRGVELTDAQKAQIQEIMAAQRTVIEPLVKQMAENRKALREATRNGQFNEDMVKALATQQGQLQAQLIVERERTQARVYNVLTPEQRAQIAERQAQMKQRFEERRQQREQRRQERKSSGTSL